MRKRLPTGRAIHPRGKAMKLLHTSDWHLGRTTGRESRASDHDAVLAEIVDAARELRPDVICNSGDLFDRSRPGTDDLERAIDVLSELAAIAPTVVVCGNHDKAALFRVFNKLSRVHGLHFIADPTTEPEAVIELPVAAGGTVRVGAVCYQHPHHLVDGRGNPDTWGSEYSAAVRGLDSTVAAAIQAGLNPQTDFAVFAAHAYVGGAGWSGTERRGRHDDIFATDPTGIPGVAYAAYGHIHRPQPLPGAAGTYGHYAGSPLQLDFGEAGQAKSMVYVEAAPGRPPRIETIPLHRGRQLRCFRGTLDDLAATADTFGTDLCQIVVDSDTHIPHVADRVQEILPDAHLVEVANNAADRRAQIVIADPSKGGQDREPSIGEMFATYLATAGSTKAPAASVLDVFHQLADPAVVDEPMPFPQEQYLPEVA
ncbi:exonuclease SbcCD subunit D [Micromonospora trifolii]|uniref:exonuclease SbcCD subunit D n=1 Tax=Micromonospora trifolii TaxID=2911208 RepID=UPI003CF3F426